MANFLPARCIVLAVDPGEVSGVAIFRNGELWDTGVTSDAGGDEDRTRESWCWCAFADAEEGLPLIIAAETWTPHGLSTASLIGMGAQWGLWLAEIKKLPRMKPTVKIVRYKPMQWRCALFGKKRYTLTRAQWDEKTIAYASAKWPEYTFDRDSAVAACIGLVASHDEKVAKMPGVRRA